MIKNRSAKKILNNGGPYIKPRRVPNEILPKNPLIIFSIYSWFSVWQVATSIQFG